ncbi:MAG: Uncharacterised protein [Owenweeksia sp. TMED14]|nr:MAG: Uncharacterised protein [Owenweeksia sp. TMED14]
MKANSVSLINAFTLIIVGSWGYIDSDSKAITALIPVIIGVILLAFNNGVKKENKMASHIAVLLTFMILLGLIKPLLGTLERSNLLATARVILMMVSTIWAMVIFIQSFIVARKAREVSSSK